MHTELMLQLNGVFYTNNSLVNLDSVGGEDAVALLCVTNAMSCCSPDEGGGSNLGQWFFPDGNTPDFPATHLSRYHMSFGPSVVRLHRSSAAATISGVYRCDLPDSSSETQTLFIGLYPVGQGMYTILLYFLIINCRYSCNQ